MEQDLETTDPWSSFRGSAQESSSVFYIDSAVFEFAPENQVIERLTDLQAKKVTYPFPSAPGRNFNVLGAGFSRKLDDWPKEYKWEEASKNGLPSDLDEVCEQFERFAANSDNPHNVGIGVRVIWRFLEQTKDSASSERSARQSFRSLPFARSSSCL